MFIQRYPRPCGHLDYICHTGNEEGVVQYRVDIEIVDAVLTGRLGYVGPVGHKAEEKGAGYTVAGR